MALISEVKFVTLGVAELDRSVAFYADAFGYAEIGRDVVNTEALGTAWRIPQGVTGRFAVMGAQGLASGMLRLVEWTPSGDHVWSKPARIQDLGPFAVNFRVRSIDTGWKRLLGAGATAKSEPRYWEVNQDIGAWDSQCFDPDGTLLDVFQVKGKIEETLGPFPDGLDASEVQTLALHVADAKASQRFYLGLGFVTMYDKVVENLESFFGVPPGTKLHNINMQKAGPRPNGRVEIAQYIGLKGKSLHKRTAPPSRGPLSMSMEVKSLDTARMRLDSLGAKAIGRASYVCPPFGEVNAATFFGPDSEVVEIFEIVS